MTATVDAPPATRRTLKQQILAAAVGLPEPFSESALVLAAWRAAPDRFGLRGFADQYPDANRVRCEVMGGRGLVQGGYLEPVSRGRGRVVTYRLTPAGRTAAGSADGPAPLRLVKVPADIAAELVRLLGTRAFRRHLTGAGLTGDDAREFWDAARLTPTAPEYAEAVLADAGGYRTADGLPLPGGRVVSDAELDRLRACHAILRDRLGSR